MHPIHLAQTATARGWAKTIGTSAKDAQVINGLFEVATNPLTGTKTVYVQKRPGSTTGTTFASNVNVLKHRSDYFTTLYATSSTLYDSSGNSLGTLTGVPSQTNFVLAESIVNNIGILAWVDTSGTGWFLYSDASTTNYPTFNGTRTAGSPILTTIASTTGIYPGQAISGTGIPASTRVLSVDSATQITMTANASSGAPTVTVVTKEAVAKIIDANFPTDANSIVMLDGFFFVGQTRGLIAQSKINDPATWPTANTIPADRFGDGIRFIFKHGTLIAASGTKMSIQYFRNAGNALGSVLSSVDEYDLDGTYLVSYPVPFWMGGAYCLARSAADTNSFGAPARLCKLTGANSITPVSDDIISALIWDLNITRIGMADMGNKPLVILHSTTNTTVIVYDQETNMFSFLSMDTAIISADRNVFTKAAGTASFSWAAGNTWTDSSSSYILTIQTEPQDMAGGLGVTDNWADLLADNEASGTATFSKTDNDYTSWETLGTFDMTKTRKRLNNLGQHDGARAYRIQHSADTGFRAQVLRINFTPGTL